MFRYPWRIIAISLLTAWAVDFLFWQKIPGISFLIWIIIVLLGAFFLARSESIQLAWQSFILFGAILLLGAIVFIREEPFTRALAIFASLGLTWLLASTYTNGYWVRFRIIDYIKAGFRSAGAALVRPAELSKNDTATPQENSFRWKNVPRNSLPYLRGLLLALPVLIVLGGLLAAADPVFSNWLADWFHIFDIDRLGEYVFRFIYILIFAYLFTGMYLYALKPKKVMDKPDPDQPMMKGFLGWTETAVILSSVNILFAVFLVVQVRYFFGGTINISETGYTYSEYARRGFNELVAVSVLSLCLYLVLGIVTKLTSKASKIGFTSLSFLLITQVFVILISAFQRLSLYEEVYGFTRLRIYSHVFMFWLGALLVISLVLEMLGRRGWFTLAALISMFGFAISLAVINVDGQVVRRNIALSLSGDLEYSNRGGRFVFDNLDSEYLKELANDVVPVMADLYENTTDEELSQLLGMHLACRKQLLEENITPWQSFTLSEIRAKAILTDLNKNLSAYQITKKDELWVVSNGTEEMFCSPYASSLYD